MSASSGGDVGQRRDELGSWQGRWDIGERLEDVAVHGLKTSTFEDLIFSATKYRDPPACHSE